MAKKSGGFANTKSPFKDTFPPQSSSLAKLIYISGLVTFPFNWMWGIYQLISTYFPLNTSLLLVGKSGQVWASLGKSGRTANSIFCHGTQTMHSLLFIVHTRWSHTQTMQPFLQPGQLLWLHMLHTEIMSWVFMSVIYPWPLPELTSTVVHTFLSFPVLLRLLKWLFSHCMAILENVEHCGGEPVLWVHINTLSYTVKSWAGLLAFMSAVYARALPEAILTDRRV